MARRALEALVGALLLLLRLKKTDDSVIGLASFTSGLEEAIDAQDDRTRFVQFLLGAHGTLVSPSDLLILAREIRLSMRELDEEDAERRQLGWSGTCRTGLLTIRGKIRPS